MCGGVHFEGAFDEGNARVCGSESSILKEVSSCVTRKVWATIALPENKYSAFQHMAFVVKVDAQVFLSS